MRSLLRKKRSAELAARSQLGITLLEIMIVLAIIGLVMAFLVGPRIMRMFSDSKESLAKTEVKTLAFQNYVEWTTKNPGKSCPGNIGELAKLGNKNAKDPWGTDYQMKCAGKGAPAGVPFGIVSAGADKQFGTKDDIHSYETGAQNK